MMIDGMVKDSHNNKQPLPTTQQEKKDSPNQELDHLFTDCTAFYYIFFDV